MTSAVKESFGLAEMQVVSFADLYAGKIVAALDRQHPRDFFDVRDLLANEGITDELLQAFLVYLISHNRPMAEILAPSLMPLQKEFVRGFEGMTREPVSVESLDATRDVLISTNRSPNDKGASSFPPRLRKRPAGLEFAGAIGRYESARRPVAAPQPRRTFTRSSNSPSLKAPSCPDV